MNMFVNELILNACVKTTEMFIENYVEVTLQVQSVIGVKIMIKTNFFVFFLVVKNKNRK